MMGLIIAPAVSDARPHRSGLRHHTPGQTWLPAWHQHRLGSGVRVDQRRADQGERFATSPEPRVGHAEQMELRASARASRQGSSVDRPDIDSLADRPDLTKPITSNRSTRGLRRAEDWRLGRSCFQVATKTEPNNGGTIRSIREHRNAGESKRTRSHPGRSSPHQRYYTL